MPDCDYCGTAFGNAGALAQHKPSCDARPTNRETAPTETGASPEQAHARAQQGQGQSPQQPQQGHGQGQGHPRGQQGQGQPQQTPAPQQSPQQTHAPARRQSPASDQQGGAGLATQGADGAVDTGMQLGDALSGMSSGNPEQAAQAKGEIFKVLGAGIARLGQRKAEEGVERHRRAKDNASRETTVASDYPECANCGGQLTEIPDTQPFPCQHCGARLRFE